ncbi:tetratricopeptide repeat protein [Pandoraea sp. CB10b_02]|uniref:tetratricopeptide repeat protein n=1 Tax=Pandoraea sp. CB10b_02 TaxID=2014535 RepID=UPI00257B7712|nr:tetratricopeptide repeat protein [Pandoraea sp. CB10b_02]
MTLSPQTRWIGAPRARRTGRAAVNALLGALCAAALSACGGPRIGGYGAPSAAALMQAQQNDEAHARAARPDSRELYLSMIRQMQEQGSYFASLAHIDQFRIQYGSAPDIDILRADALRETGQPDAALQAYGALLDGPQAAAAWHGTGLVAAQRKDYAGAARALREAVSRAPTEAFYLSDLGFALLCSGDASGARVPLAQAAELRPDSRKVLGNLAVYLVVAGERSRADEMMAQAKMPQATREAIDKLAADIRAQMAARRAAAQASLRPAPPAPPVPPDAAGKATPSSARALAADGPVVVRLGAGESSSGWAGAAAGAASQAAAEAKLARASDASRSDMPTSLLDRFGHSQ